MTYAVTISGNNISFSMTAMEYPVSLSQSGLQGAKGDTGTIEANTGATIGGDLTVAGDLLHGNAGPLVAPDGVNNYATRAALVTDVSGGQTWADGTIVSDGTVAYVASAGATAISDLGGLLPFGDVYVDHFGTNAVPGTTDMTAAINAAISYAPAGSILRVRAGSYLISSTIVVTKSLTIFCEQGAENGANGSPTNSSLSSRLVWSSGASAAPMMRWQASTSGDVISRGGILGGLLFDGNNVATIGLHLRSVAYNIFDVITYRTTTHGCLIDDGNSALTNGVRFIRFEHFCGPDAAAHACDAMFIDGDVTGFFATNIVCDFFEAEVVNGHGLTFRAVDSCDFQRVKTATRSGGAYTGFHVRFLKSVNYTTFHAQKNKIGMLIAGGDIYFGDYTKNNIIENCIAEYGSVFYESSGANKRTNHISRMIDFRNGGSWQTPQFKLSDLKTIPLQSMSSYGTTATASTLGGTSAGTTWSFSASATQGVSYSDVSPAEWGDGFVSGVRIVLQSVGAVTGDVVFKVQFLGTSDSGAIGGFSRSATETLTPAQSVTNNITAHEILFASEDAISPFGVYCVTVERLGADAADTYPNAIVLCGLQLKYRATGPDSAATYGPYNAFLIGGADANP